ncbi:MAG: PhoH family protein [Clostridia bacterium]|nr:PhoH family protein [Clostridia bacterium]
MIEQVVNVERIEQIINLFGSFDENIKLLEKEYNVHIINRDTELRISGDAEDVMHAQQAIESLLALAARGEQISVQNVHYIISLVREGQQDKLDQMGKGVICVTVRGKPVKAKTLGQQSYIDAIQNNIVTVGVGPAGTGKTYLAVASAVAAFRRKEINRIILTRPAVEAGEKLGFLPGDLQNKVDPYLRPLYDALFDMFGPEAYHRYLERGNIEVAPLAYMRGRTLDDAFIILDEAQNTTPEQMKMFLTRIGFGSKAVITGDVTQIDLPNGKTSGLKEACAVLQGIDDIAIQYLDHRDVVRHELVAKIIQAYDKHDKAKQSREARKKEFKIKKDQYYNRPQGNR